ncbi:hypothetical protein M427DRAFT_66861 [Gonapodya prolifera JEL478]|uniref:Homologous recombination OB-fold protein OB-fold domain-containing protein n=1 Tax=Gonapodya prolifera (strain JEL478) TaxID=1344416 RepID=A0A139ASH9_GONPJ|nr:hypothetical protein M427DRAFT_66861 [Gonapodya prolifera JEL478]|eukprot:KXS19698.1 hypothetical protein M427DRAFT_66861 [Gonapodya prolifera JEL478]
MLLWGGLWGGRPCFCADHILRRHLTTMFTPIPRLANHIKPENASAHELPPQQGFASSAPSPIEIDSTPPHERRIPGPIGGLPVLSESDLRALMASKPSHNRATHAFKPAGAQQAQAQARARANYGHLFVGRRWEEAFRRCDAVCGGQAATLAQVKANACGDRVPWTVVTLVDWRTDEGVGYAKAIDPSEEMPAYVSEDALKEHPALGEGSVLVLRNATVFRHASAASLLNVTSGNIASVH